MNNKYLEKIAKKEKSNWNGKALPAYMGASMGAGLVHSVVSKPLFDNVMTHVNREKSVSGADLGTIKKMMRDNNLHHTTTFNTREHAFHKNFSSDSKSEFMKGALGGAREASVGAKGPVFMPLGKVFGGKKDYVSGVKRGKGTVGKDVIMHELGHAKDFSSFAKTKMGIRMAGAGLKGASVAALTNDKTRDYAVPLAVAGALPTLRDEAAANYHAYHGIKAHKGAAAANRYLRKLVPGQMGHYALGAAASVGTIYGAKKILDHFDKNKK